MMRDRAPFAVRDEIASMRAYTLEKRFAADKLDQNESPFDLPPELKREVVERVVDREWNRYPDFELRRLREALARGAEIDVDCILAGNGSNELIAAAVATFVSRGTRVVIPSPTFALYEKLAVVNGGEVVSVRFDPAAGRLPGDAILREVDRCDEAPVVVICSPNNPTGGTLDRRDLDRLLDSGAMVLFDRAYGEFEGGSAPRLHERLVVFSTFSKAWGIAGLRVGWLAATAENCREIRKVKLPYNLNVFSEEAALAVLDRPDLVRTTVDLVRRERERVFGALSGIHGVTAFASRANFIAFRLDADADRVFDALLDRGVLVRNVSGYPMMERCLRVSIGAPEQNDRFLVAIEETMTRAGERRAS